MSDPQTQNSVVQFTDSLTSRRFAVRIIEEHAGVSLSALMDLYLKKPSISDLLRQGRISEGVISHIGAIQDYVYLSSDSGVLHEPFDGIEFIQDGNPLRLDETVKSRDVLVDGQVVKLIEIEIDRTGIGYDRNWVGFHRRRWDRDTSMYEGFVREAVIQSKSSHDLDEVLSLDSGEAERDFVDALARRIWEAPFENFSRFTGSRLPFKTGDETIRSICDGGGGICTEKIQALKFLTDHYALESEYVLAGPYSPGPVPEERLRELLTTFDFTTSRRYMRYWQHIALLYHLDTGDFLVDATNGNIPYLFLGGREVEQILGYEAKQPVRVRMAVNSEDYYYHRVSQQIVNDLLFALEGWIPYVDLVQVFDNELGLFIGKEFMVAPVMYRTEDGFDTIRIQYEKACAEAGLACEVLADWSLSGSMGYEFAELDPSSSDRIIASKKHLLDRYEQSMGRPYEAGLAVISLQGRPCTTH